MQSRVIAGLVIIAIGVLFLLNQITGLSLLGDLWPLIIIVVALALLLTRSGPLLGGLILLAVGVLLQLSALDLLGSSFWRILWPVILVIVGVSMLLPRLSRRTGPTTSHLDTVDYFVIFGGRNERVESPSFRGGTITSVFGGTELDLRGSSIATTGASLDVNVAFGGVDLTVPPNWQVQISGLPIFGGWDNKTRKQAAAQTAAPQAPVATPTGEPSAAGTQPAAVGAAEPILRIKAFVMFGGLEVKN